MGRGVRDIDLAAIAPQCEIVMGRIPYDLSELARGKTVLDIGCGFGELRKLVEDVGGKWIGVEPFPGGGHTIAGEASALPFADGCADLIVMEAVLEHIPDVAGAFAEVSRVLRRGGKFVGYAAFMECFHEISYAHLSFKALEYYAARNGMRLASIADAGRFGIDYHLSVLLYPIPSQWLAAAVAAAMRGTFRAKAAFAQVYLRRRRRMSAEGARRLAEDYLKVERLRQSVGFYFVIAKDS